MMRPRFTIRTVLGVMLIVGLILGWYSSARQGDARVARLSQQLRYAEEELKRSQRYGASWDRVGTPSRSSKDKRGLLAEANLDGTNWKGASIVGGAGAFTLTSFVDCNLQGATLTGNTSSFQYTKLDSSNLVDAQLTGGVSAFQYASFTRADLSRAVITGGGAAFQFATLDGAKLIGAKLRFGGAGFQKVNINGAQFQRADLSMITADALASCYFNTPPSYDEKTRFPEGFDPVAAGWQLVSSQEPRTGN